MTIKMFDNSIKRIEDEIDHHINEVTSDKYTIEKKYSIYRALDNYFKHLYLHRYKEGSFDFEMFNSSIEQLLRRSVKTYRLNDYKKERFGQSLGQAHYSRFEANNLLETRMVSYDYMPSIDFLEKKGNEIVDSNEITKRILVNTLSFYNKNKQLIYCIDKSFLYIENEDEQNLDINDIMHNKLKILHLIESIKKIDSMTQEEIDKIYNIDEDIESYRDKNKALFDYNNHISFMKNINLINQENFKQSRTKMKDLYNSEGNIQKPVFGEFCPKKEEEKLLKRLKLEADYGIDSSSISDDTLEKFKLN